MFPSKLPLEDYIYSWYTIAFALGVGLILGFRNYMHGMPCPSDKDAKGKVIVITGGTRGIGKELGREMATRGAKVILACRDEEEGKQSAEDIFLSTKNKNVHSYKLDLSSFESIRNFASVMNHKKHSIDVLVNNAGIMCHPREDTAEGHEMHFGVNYLGHFLLTELLMDKLKASKARIINATAIAYQIAQPDLDDLKFEKREYQPGDAYSQSKLCILWWTRHLAKKLEGTGVTVNAYHPGVVNTDLYRNMPFRQSKFVSWSFTPIFWLLMKKARDGAQTPLYMAVSDEEKRVSGKFYAECRMKPVDPIAEDPESEEKLWKLSRGFCGLDEEEETATSE